MAREILKQTISRCREILEKPEFSIEDEQNILTNVKQCLHSCSTVGEQRELTDRIEELLLIKKYKLIYRQIVQDETNYFDSTGLLSKINHTLRVI